MKWFRFYSEAIHEPKVLLLRPEARWAWIVALAMASDNKPRGTLPALQLFAMSLRVPEPKAKEYLDLLIDAGLIDVQEDGALRPHNWDERQRKSDDVADRVRSFRERNGNVTGNVTETYSLRARAQEAEAEAEGERLNDAPTPPNPPADGGGGARAFGSANGEGEGDLTANPDEVARLVAAVEALHPGRRFGPKVRDRARRSRPAMILWACEDAAGRDKSVGWPYITAIIDRQEAEGGPDPPAAATPARSKGQPWQRPVGQLPSAAEVRREREEADRKRDKPPPSPEQIAQWREWADGSDATNRTIARKCLAELDPKEPQ